MQRIVFFFVKVRNSDRKTCFPGYSVGAGNFLSPVTVEVVGGAPQYNQRGKVGPYLHGRGHVFVPVGTGMNSCLYLCTRV